MRGLRRTALAATIIVAMSAGAAHAASQPSTGGGDTGTSGKAPAGTTMCFISSGTGSNYFVGASSTTLTASLNWSVPAGNFTMKTRFVSTGGDGSVTEDTGWRDSSFGDSLINYPGPESGQSGDYIPDSNNSIDVSGGTLFEVQFTDTSTGQTFEADGQTYPPDPVTGSC